MSIRTVLIVVLALVCGGSAAVGVNSLRQPQQQANRDMVQVVVAAVDIHRGESLSTELVSVRNWPKDGVPPGAVTRLEDALDRAVLHPLGKGELVQENRLAPKGAGRGLAALVPKGMRAFTIRTPNVASNVAGFVLPGNKVDILLTVSGTADDGGTGGSTTTLLQYVEILAVDRHVDAPRDSKADGKQLASVTLLVTPDQAAKLELGQSKGSLCLSLRNLTDDQPARTRPTTMKELRFLQEKPWDERARSLLEGFGKALGKELAKTPPAKAEPAPKPAPEPERTQRLYIRTFRGNAEGRIHVLGPRR